MLVFAKNSLQAEKISPSTPRAIYFNDEVMVGYIPGGDLFELAALAVDGPVLYTIPSRGTERERFQRKAFECSSCHGRDPARLTATSITPDNAGLPSMVLGGAEKPLAVDHRTPFEQRWGGWYVTGTHGSQRHRGNARAVDPFNPFELERDGTQNQTALPKRVEVSRYVASTSDIVALMTFEHQVRMENLLVRITRQARQLPGRPEDDAAFDMTVDELVRYMLFIDEAPLIDPVRGTSSFSRTFPERGPRDRQGRSLRDFDLERRLFRYPLSYMIYSDAFNQLPFVAQERVYRRLHDVLTGSDSTAAFSRLTEADRRDILEIVRDTKSNLPSYWLSASR